jgi:hypothetical protein
VGVVEAADPSDAVLVLREAVLALREAVLVLRGVVARDRDAGADGVVGFGATAGVEGLVAAAAALAGFGSAAGLTGFGSAGALVAFAPLADFGGVVASAFDAWAAALSASVIWARISSAMMLSASTRAWARSRLTTASDS